MPERIGLHIDRLVPLSTSLTASQPWSTIAPYAYPHPKFYRFASVGLCVLIQRSTRTCSRSSGIAPPLKISS